MFFNAVLHHPIAECAQNKRICSSKVGVQGNLPVHVVLDFCGVEYVVPVLFYLPQPLL